MNNNYLVAKFKMFHLYTHLLSYENKNRIRTCRIVLIRFYNVAICISKNAERLCKGRPTQTGRDFATRRELCIFIAV